MKYPSLLLLSAVPRLATASCPATQVPFGATCTNATTIYTSAYNYLLDNMPSYDLTNMNSLGFGSLDTADGLDDGVGTVGINNAIAAKQLYPWASTVPEDVWLEYVVPYAHVNEGRTNWRPVLRDAVDYILADIAVPPNNIKDAVNLINGNLYDPATSNLPNAVVFKSSQTPLIYDPMSTLVFGYASCTGVSILFANALRAVGIPARVVGTPAWNDVEANGNHNWVEVWVDGTWEFIEAEPAGGEETLTNPCDKWFCSPAKMANGTRFYATAWTKGSVVYPMAWDLENEQVQGVDRTEYYQTACGSC